MTNKAFLNVQFCGRRHTIESEEIKLQKLAVEIEKHGPSCPYVLEGETVEFRIMVRNKSDIELRGVEFVDPLHSDFEYVPHSFRVDGRHERPHLRRGELSFRFGRFGPHCEHEITFRVRIADGNDGSGEGEGEGPGGPPWAGGPGQGGPSRPPVWSPGPGQGPGGSGPSGPGTGGPEIGRATCRERV